MKENLLHILKYGEIDKFYYLYGFDIKGFRDDKEYVSYKEFMTLRNRKNKYPNNYDIGVLRNKFHFSFIGEKLGLPVIKNSYIIDNGLISRLGSEEDTLLEFGSFLTSLLNFSFFIKTLSGECSDGVFSVSKTKGVYFLNTEKSNRKESNKIFFKRYFYCSRKN